jgi:hypothetical protein
MSDFVSNTPISRPAQVNWTADFDIGGMCWSYQWGMFYKTSSDNANLLPIRLPSPITGQG